MARVLLVDDEPDFVAATIELLRFRGHEVTSADTLAGARETLRRSVPDVLLLDLMLPDGNGLELLEQVPVTHLRRTVLITGHPGIKAHIKNLVGPSVTYLTKPVDGAELASVLAEVDETETPTSPSADKRGRHFGLIIGEHEKMREIYERIHKVARNETPVLVSGETGTGKELVAEAVHRGSGRRGDFVAVNCGSLSRELAASELFGHEKGSFTGAMRSRAGLFKRADGGTLFLDEITEMPLELQPYLLRVLETRTVLSVGGQQEAPIDVRIIAATNRDPDESVADGVLRQDLYFRLSAFPIEVPPLRERRSDIRLLTDHFLASLQGDRRPRRFSAASLVLMESYHWPGNVRELKHLIQHALLMTDPTAIELELPRRFDSPFGVSSQRGLEPGRSIRDVERELIERTLSHFAGDKKLAAEALGISLNTLYNRLNLYRASKD